MTSVRVREPSLTRSDSRDELDRTLEHYGTKGVVVDLRVWIVGRSFEIGGKQAMRAVAPVRFDSLQEIELGGSVCHA